MKRVTSECSQIRHSILRRDTLDAVQRGLLDVHLRRCDACREIAQDLNVIENGFTEVAEISKDRRQAIYNRLIPAVNEITIQQNESRRFWDRFQIKPSYALAAGCAALVLVAFLFSLLLEKSSTVTNPLEKQAAVVLKNVEHDGIVDHLEGVIHVDGKDITDKDSFVARKGTKIRGEKGSRFSFRIGDLARVALSEDVEWELTAVSTTYVAIRLDKGQLAIDFNGQAGKVLEVFTPDLLVRVKGTIFTVEVKEDSETRVGVVEGIVDVVYRHGDTRTVEVNRDELFTTKENGKLAMLTDEQRSLAAQIRLINKYPEVLTRVIRFDGSPEKVKVEVDGRVIGTTPLTVRLPSGPFAYKLTSPEMEPVVGRIADPKSRVKVNFAMSPADDYEPMAIRDDEETKLIKRGWRRNKASKKRSSSRGRVWDLFERARAAMTAGDIPYAIGLLERAIENVSGKRLVSGLALLAECYAAAGMYGKAANAFDRITQIVPNSTAAQNAHYEVGRLSMDKLGDLSRARAAFTAYVASELGGGLKEDAYYSLCELDGREGAHRAALHCFNQFLLAFLGGHHEPEARLWRGALHQDVDRSWDPAERDLLAFVKARPSHPRADEARYRVAIGRYQMGNKRGALAMIADYLRKHPNGLYRLRVERLRRAILDPNFSLALDSK